MLIVLESKSTSFNLIFPWCAFLGEGYMDTAKMSKNQVGEIERGEISTSVVNLNLLAEALGVEIKDFFDFYNEQ